MLWLWLVEYFLHYFRWDLNPLTWSLLSCSLAAQLPPLLLIASIHCKPQTWITIRANVWLRIGSERPMLLVCFSLLMRRLESVMGALAIRQEKRRVKLEEYSIIVLMLFSKALLGEWGKTAETHFTAREKHSDPNAWFSALCLHLLQSLCSFLHCFLSTCYIHFLSFSPSFKFLPFFLSSGNWSWSMYLLSRNNIDRAVYKVII